MKNIQLNLEDNQQHHPFNDVAGMWALRILLNLNGINNLAANLFGITNDGEILKTFGLAHLEGVDIDKKEFMEKLRDQQTLYESRKPGIKGVLKRNLKQFGQLVGLSKTELKILGFAVAMCSHCGLENTADTLGNLNGSDVIGYLSTILDIPLEKVQDALSSKGILSDAGILRLSKNGNAYLRAKLCLMRGLEDVLQEPHADRMEMVHDYFHAVREPSLSAKDYEHVEKDYRLIARYLAKASENRLPGVNILLHGGPGTGKTEFGRTIATELGCELFEISVVDRDGDAVTGNHRFSAYQLCQKILSRQKNTIVLFDEVEDVFPERSESFFRIQTQDDRRKAWINRLLEENPVPSIWVSNNIDQIDKAFIRRFDFVLKMGHPPKNIRTNILKKHFSELNVSGKWIDSVAENPNIAPALVSRAARVASVIDEDENDSTKIETHLEHIMGNTLEAMGYSGATRQKRKIAMSYRLDALNPDVDICQLVEGLKHRAEGRFCLYGPPGTGKTEFGHYVAKVLEKPLMVKRASDLLGPYVGMTEKKIAGMCQQAQEDGAVLLLDEADSFLRDRRGARQSWEVTQVNEMLTQMENYDGIFICSTNLVDNLDSASIRRFDFKIYFDYLELEQSWVLFQQVLKDSDCAIDIDDAWRNRLAKFTNLTPGDFATVVRQNRLRQKALDVRTLINGLSRESDFKAVDNSAGIGFTANI